MHTPSRVDIYLASATGDSLHDAVLRYEEFGEDLSRYEADPAARVAVVAHLHALHDDGWLHAVDDDALVIAVLGWPTALARIFGCAVVAADDGNGCELEGIPSLPGCDRWIDAIDRGRVVRAPARVACRIRGHDWDILAFDSPYGLIECMRCGEREDTFPAMG